MIQVNESIHQELTTRIQEMPKLRITDQELAYDQLNIQTHLDKKKKKKLKLNSIRIKNLNFI